MAQRATVTAWLLALAVGAAACGGGEGGTAAGEDEAPENAAAPVMESGADAPPIPTTNTDAPPDTSSQP